MAILKCKMCGGDLEVTAGTSVAECEYCGTKQTLPKADDEVIQNLFNRANNLRLKSEFDKAEQIYEKILQKNDAEAEAHWGIVLCKFGIEYVEDPTNFKRLPTCHRTSYDAVTADPDYQAAVAYADDQQKHIYEAEAKAIDAIQKDILNIVKNEKPFDVFICYKETDENGKRTVDSVIANDIYHQLTQEGLKVFYAAITLEDKLGQAYEPYIFAALNSAKVMLVIGTQPAYFNAVWVKNEWSRFLKLMKTDRPKLLIPCYKDMDAYDLPKEFSHLQAQDMAKIGFINDIVRGIRKVAKTETPKAAVVKETVLSAANTNTAPLLKRAFMFLEDGDWNSADEYCEKVLDIDPECAQAYLGKLMSQLRVRKQEELKNQAEPFDDNNNYQKAIRFADGNSRAILIEYSGHIKYTRAKNMMSAANTEKIYKEAAALFDAIPDYQDSAALAAECLEKAEAVRKDTILAKGKVTMAGVETISDYEAAIKLFTSISGWKDADKQVEVCREKIEQLKAQAEERERQAEMYRQEAERIAKRNKKIGIIAAPIACAIFIFVIVLNTVIIPNNKYNDALALMDGGEYAKAISVFEELDGYKDSADKVRECHYYIAEALQNKGEYAKAAIEFGKLGNYKDSAEKKEECNIAILDGQYNDAVALMEQGKYTEAISVFASLNSYKDSREKIGECNTLILNSGEYNNATALLYSGKYAEAAIAFGKLGDYKDSVEKSKELWERVAVRNTIAAESHTVGLKSNGTVVSLGYNSCGQCEVSDWTDIIAVSAGSGHTVGLKSDGTVVAVGDNEYGQCDVSNWTDIVAVSAGDWHTVGLKSDGTVVAVGNNWDGKCDDWTDIIAVSAGDWHAVGLKSDGTVVAVGDNEYGQCDVSNWTDIIAVSAGRLHTVGLRSDGTVVAVGYNYYSQCDVSNWTDIVAVSAGAYHTVGLKSDGTVVAVGNDRSGQCHVRDWTDIIAIFAGDGHTVGLKSDGTVVAVGYNGEGQCDVSNWTDIKLPNKK